MAHYFRAPKSCPPLALLLADLGGPKPAQVAKFLQVSERTVFNWLSKEQAPRAVELALFWESSYGQQWLHSELFNRVQVLQSLSNSLGQELARVRADNARLIAELGQVDHGAANDPAGVGAPVGEFAGIGRDGRVLGNAELFAAAGAGAAGQGQRIEPAVRLVG